MIGAKQLAIIAAAALVAAGAAAPFMDLPVLTQAKSPDLLSMLHKRSPEERQVGALAQTKTRVSMKLSAAVPAAAAAPTVPAAAAPAMAAPVSAALPLVQAPAAVPIAFVPAVAPVAVAPVAAVPAIFPVAAGSGLLLLPMVVPAGGGGGGFPIGAITPPGGGGAPPPPVPGVPEPRSWAMMIIGFGMLGGLLRRRRRALRITAASDTGASVQASAL